MSRIFQLSTTTLCLTLAAVLSLAMASGPCTATDARAATAPSTANVAQQRQQTLDELDEVWVRGKRLSREISDVEDDLFKLYNKLNKNHEYDILCGFTWLGRDDMVMRRVCMPAFVADSRATYMSASPSVYLPGPSLVCGGYSGGELVGPYPCNSGTDNFYSTPAPAIVGPPPSHVLEARREAYANNVIDVINSDPRLLEKYRNLVGLYEKMNQTQDRYVATKKAVIRIPLDRRPARVHDVVNAR